MLNLCVFFISYSNDSNNYGAFAMLSKFFFCFAVSLQRKIVPYTSPKKTKQAMSEVHVAFQNGGGQP